MTQTTTEFLKVLAQVPALFPESDELLIGSRAAQFVVSGTVNVPGGNRDWDIIAIPKKVIEWVNRNATSIKEISYVAIPGTEISASVVLQQGEAVDTVDFVIPTYFQSGCAQLLLYINREPVVTVPFPGGTCRVPSIDVLLTIKRSHLYFPVKWEAHINSYHALLKHKTTAHSKILDNIRTQLTKEATIIHKDKRIAPQLPAFASEQNISELSVDEKQELLLSLLENYKTTFETCSMALAWACTTGPTPFSDAIIDNYPELRKAGEAIWNDKSGGVRDNSKKSGLATGFSALRVANLPSLSFGSFNLASEVSLLIFSDCRSQALKSCASVCREWSVYFRNKKVWHQLYVLRWNKVKENDDTHDWKKYYIQRCKDVAFWDIPVKEDEKAAVLRNITQFVRNMSCDQLMEVSDKLIAAYNVKSHAPQFADQMKELKIGEDELQAQTEKLAKFLEDVYVTNYYTKTGFIDYPSVAKVTLLKYESLEPRRIVVTCESGERGNSRHSYYCVQLTLEVDNKKILSFDNLELFDLRFAKWDYYPNFFGFLSDRKVPFLDIPSRIAVAMCFLLFPEEKRKSLIDNYAHLVYNNP